MLNDVIEPIKGADWVKESLRKYALGRATDPKRISKLQKKNAVLTKSELATAKEEFICDTVADLQSF